MTRTLIYAMQSSGASAYAFKIGKIRSLKGEKVLCIPDLWNPHLAIPFKDVSADAIIQKVVVTNKYTLEQHIRSFEPTEVILFQREREHNRRSLQSKSYANENGDMEFKFSLFDSECDKRPCNITYEKEALQWMIIYQHELDAMAFNNSKLSQWAKDEYLKSWGFGGISVSGLI